MAIQNITLNGYNLQDSTVLTRKLDHQNISIDQSKLKIPHRDGAKQTNYSYSGRTIMIEGMLSSVTASGLDGKLDEFKKNIIGAMAVNLDFDYEGTTRRYVVNVKNVALPKEHYNLTMSPFSIECEAINPPFGLDTVSVSGITSTTLVSGTITGTTVISGTANPRPLIRFVVNTASTLTDIEFKNNTTATSIKISPTSFSNNDIVEIDTDLYTVNMNNAPVNFTGTLPTFTPGTNNWQISLYTTASGTSIDVQQTADTSQDFDVHAATTLAQTFTPATSGNFNQIDLKLDKYNSPTDDLTVNVKSGSLGGSGVLVATTTISRNNISTTAGWVSAIFSTPFALTAGTTYYIEITAFNTARSAGIFAWFADYINNPYANGKAYASTDYGNTYYTLNSSAADYCFKLYKTSGSSAKVGYGMQYTRRYL